MLNIKNGIFIIFTCIAMVLSGCNQSSAKLSPLNPQDIILAFGDSLTYGTGAPPEASYPLVLAGKAKLNVVNAGVPGEETSGGLIRISDELQKYNPKLVILCLGGNDLIHRTPDETIKSNLLQIINIIKKSGAQVLLIAVPRFNFGLEVPDFYNELANETSIPVDDNILVTLEKIPAFKSDYIHFNLVGYKKMADAIYDDLKKYGALEIKN